jgi:predicted nucleotidyltransferase
MLQKLFSSKARVRLLNTFFLHPEGSFYLRELERMTGEDYKSISNELRNLETIGLLHSNKSGNMKYFRLNQDFLFFNELKSIFFKTMGAAALLKQVLNDIEVIESAFIYGSYASGTENDKSDIDLMVIGKCKMENILKLLRVPEKTLGREINVSLYESSEIRKRIKKHDPFITKVIAEQKIMLKGDEDGLRNLAK